jgi:hypothetical protein
VGFESVGFDNEDVNTWISTKIFKSNDLNTRGGPNPITIYRSKKYRPIYRCDILRRIAPVRYGDTVLEEKRRNSVSRTTILCMPLSVMMLDRQKRLFPVADSYDVIETPGKRYCIVSSSFNIQGIQS